MSDIGRCWSQTASGIGEHQQTSSCGSAVRAETKRELKAQRKSPGEAGQMSRACAAPDAITVRLPAVTTVVATIVATAVAAVVARVTEQPCALRQIFPKASEEPSPTFEVSVCEVPI